VRRKSFTNEMPRFLWHLDFYSPRFSFETLQSAGILSVGWGGFFSTHGNERNLVVDGIARQRGEYQQIENHRSQPVGEQITVLPCNAQFRATIVRLRNPAPRNPGGLSHSPSLVLIIASQLPGKPRKDSPAIAQ